MLAEENPHPPSQFRRRHHHRSRGGGGCSCCCLNCLCECGRCILSCVMSIICTILVVIGVVVLVLYLLVKPHQIVFHATSASLSRFSLSLSPQQTTPWLSYSLSINFTTHNPNSRIGVYYDDVDAQAYYSDHILGNVSLISPFYQAHENTADLGPALFNGTVVDEDGKFEKEKGGGVFEFQVRLLMSVRFRILILIKTGRYRPRVDCDLKVPLDGAGSGYTFQSTRCHYHL